MARELREVVFVDGVRTAFGKAGPKGQFWRTRADDMAVKVVRELLRRNPEIPVERRSPPSLPPPARSLSARPTSRSRAASSTWATTRWARTSTSTPASSPSG
jgi:acetyl-CoA acetyltransferase